MRTSNKWIVAAGSAGLAMVSASSVLAQEQVEPPSYFAEPVLAPRDALELGVGAGYSQGTMSPVAGVGPTDLTKAGGAFSLRVGYRFTPEFALHLFGEYDEFVPGDAFSNAGTRGGVAGVNGTFHILPYQRIDPWVRLGVGYRMLWATGDPAVADTLWHGFQLARVNVGADLRTTEDFAIGPTIGIDLSECVWKNPAGDAGDEEILGKREVPFVDAGLEGRFDLAGSREPRIPRVAAAP